MEEKRGSYSISGRIFIKNTGENPALVSGISDVVWYKLKGDNPWQEAVSDISTEIPSVIPVNDGLAQEFSYSGTFELPEGVSPDDISLRNELEITISNHPDGEHTFHTEQSFEISEDQRACPDRDDDWDDWDDWEDWEDKDWDDRDDDEDWEDEDWGDWAMSDEDDINIGVDFSSTTITLISADATTTINITTAIAPDFETEEEIIDENDKTTEQETEQTDQETEEILKEEPIKEPTEEIIEETESWS